MTQLPSQRSHGGITSLGHLRRRQYATKGFGGGMGVGNGKVHPDANGHGVDMYEQIKDEPGMDKFSREEWLVLEHEVDDVQRITMIKSMALPIPTKKLIRSKLSLEDVKSQSGWAAWKAKQKVKWHRTKLKFKELSIRLELWRNSFKKIEGHYGSGVASYFVFLKWLFFLNMYIFLLLFIFIVIPQLAFVGQGYDYWVIGNTSTVRLNQSAVCSELYRVNISYNDVPQLVLDFLQGTGWMEPTVLFYGYYTDRSLSIGNFGGTTYSYNMPLAYILITIIYLALSLFLMVRHTASGMKARLIEQEERFSMYCNVAFSGWDFTMNDVNSAELKHKALYNEMVGDLEEERQKRRRASRTCGRKCGLYTLRFILNVIVIATLGAGGYLIYYATEQSTLFTQRSDYADMNKFVKLLMEYVPSLTITVLNFVIPFFFKILVKGEDYSPDFEIQITLIRTVFVRLASLAVLIGTLYSQITCQVKDDECDVGIQPECPEIRCWETYVGQQIYKLVILDFITVIGVIFLVQFPRNLMVTKCGCKLAKLIGKPEFEIPKNVLDIIYSQTLCWLGGFFCPLIPAICVIKSFLVFYLKKLTCIYNHVPSARPYRASSSQTFFMVVLLSSFILCCVPIGWVLWRIPPSKGCGTFRIYEYMYDIITITINSWPDVIQQIVTFIASAGFVVPLFVIFIIVIYYNVTAVGAYKEMGNMYKEQLVLEGKDKQFLLNRINELTGHGPPGQGKQNIQESRRHKQKPVSPVTASGVDVEDTKGGDISMTSASDWN